MTLINVIFFRLECNFEFTNGGYLKLYNRDSPSQRTIITQYFSGSTNTVTETFTFDYDDPLHCVRIGGICQFGPSMLNVGDDVTTEVKQLFARFLLANNSLDIQALIYCQVSPL